MDRNAAAYYLWPAVWVASAPSTDGTSVDLEVIAEEVCRTTLGTGIAAKVLREGIFVFDFSSWPPGQAPENIDDLEYDVAASIVLQRVAVMNAHLACLYTCVASYQQHALEKMVVTPSELISLAHLDDTGMAFGDARVGALALSSYASSYAGRLPMLSDWRLRDRWMVVDTQAVQQSFGLLDAILESEAPYGLLLADLYLRSCKAYEDHNYSLCLVIAWSISEKLLQTLWKQYVQDNRDRAVDGRVVRFINNERQKFLTGSRDFTAAVVSEALSLVDILPLKLYQCLGRVRKARNHWMHELQPATRAEAEQAVELAEQMLDFVLGFELKAPLVSGLHW